jgi:F0F1-type ATP synthase assembly protein I
MRAGTRARCARFRALRHVGIVVTDRRDEEVPPKSRQGAAYQGALEAVFAILIGAFLGRLADDHFGTTPRYLLVGLLVGFAAFVLRLVRMRRYLPDTAPKDESDDQ